MNRVDEFMDTLITTNKKHDYFTDWLKINKYQAKYKDELALLSVLTGAKDPETELKRLLVKYPKIVQLLPLLMAVRTEKTNNKILIIDEDYKKITYDFGGTGNVNSLVQFSVRTGLLKELVTVTNHRDYYFGVEVGSDTNARKNRSGKAMELLVEPFVGKLCNKYKGTYKTQMTFSEASEHFDIEVPSNQGNKKGDFMLLVRGVPINIETNYFDGGGSKQEVINSYISRKEDLEKAGWKFAIVTDGIGWKSNRTQIKQAYDRIGQVYNIDMCRKSKLDRLINS